MFYYYNNKACKQTEGYCSQLPVDTEAVSDGLTDELTVFLQGVECILDRLVDRFLDGATHLLDLVDTAAWLRAATPEKRIITYTWQGG